ncbi:MAG TPA: CGNR zinc finger domain-containing protein [Candidatus Limnocylindrales bacterium]|nr:CGNR zinc finger domain-containing protein [Candidatus Limnocylindrales bacterium]
MQTSAPAIHDHHVDLDAALDFINTLDLDESQLVEHFVEPSDARTWFTDHGLVHPDVRPRWTGADLDHVRDLRRALRDVVEAVVDERRPGPGSVDLVNRALEGRRPPRLVLDGTAVRIGHRHAEAPIDDALAVIAEAIVGELATGRPERFRVCANDRCRWTFFDSSPTGRRRWCDMATCGNRAKAARHRARAKASTTPATTPQPGPTAARG